jgi:murein L,D-transpeptidase YcbB/YkuD
MVRYVFRQDPGPWNVLGRVKFIFPNRYNVYFHDTSEPGFFSERLRTFSHGCIRVSQPQELAAWVLDGDSQPTPWSPIRIRAAIGSGEHQTVRLGKPIPVHIVYRTVLAGPGPSLQFLPDIYGRDAALEASLQGYRKPAVSGESGVQPSRPGTPLFPKPPGPDRTPGASADKPAAHRLVP